jgi:hypothetical protein
MQTLTTLGLGDVKQTSPLTKLFLSFYSLFGTAIFGGVVGAMASIPLEMNEKKAKESVLDSLPDELNSTVYKFLSSGSLVQRLGLSRSDGYCTRNEFTLLVLVRQGLVTEEELQMCRDKFNKLDTDGSGKITRVDLVQVRMINTETARQHKPSYDESTIRRRLDNISLLTTRSTILTHSTQPLVLLASLVAGAGEELGEGGG